VEKGCGFSREQDGEAFILVVHARRTFLDCVQRKNNRFIRAAKDQITWIFYLGLI
jgi:hypothetical protein